MSASQLTAPPAFPSGSRVAILVYDWDAGESLTPATVVNDRGGSHVRVRVDDGLIFLVDRASLLLVEDGGAGS